MMENSNTQLGLMISGDTLFFVEATTGQPQRLLTADVMHLGIPFDVQAFGDPDMAVHFSNSINQLLDRFAISAKTASVCLDRRLVLLKRLRVDQDLRETDIRQQIEWELEQVLVAPRDEYHANYEKFRHERDHYDHIVVAVVRKAVIAFLQNIIKATPLKLQQVDVELLAMIRGMSALKLEFHALSALIEIEPTYASVTLLKNQCFLSQGEIKYAAAQLTDSNSEQIATLINDEILRQLDTLGDEVLLKNVEQLFLINSNIPSGIIYGLQRLQRNALVQIVAPLERLEHSLSLEAEQLIKDNPGRILPLLGLLRS